MPVPSPGPPGSIAAVKRILAGIVAVLAVLATGAATSACNVTPSAATVNGDSISVSSLNTQLHGLDLDTGRAVPAVARASPRPST